MAKAQSEHGTVRRSQHWRALRSQGYQGTRGRALFLDNLSVWRSSGGGGPRGGAHRGAVACGSCVNRIYRSPGVRLNVRKNRARPFCSPQDQIHCGILFLTRQLRNLSRQEREQCLKDIWEWALRRADLLTLQMIRGYREYCRRSGSTYLRHRAWYWSNRDNPEFWAEWERRFARSETEGTVDSIRVNWS